MGSLVPLGNFRHIPDEMAPALVAVGVSEQNIQTTNERKTRVEL